MRSLEALLVAVRFPLVGPAAATAPAATFAPTGAPTGAPDGAPAVIVSNSTRFCVVALLHAHDAHMYDINTFATSMYAQLLHQRTTE